MCKNLITKKLYFVYHFVYTGCCAINIMLIDFKLIVLFHSMSICICSNRKVFSLYRYRKSLFFVATAQQLSVTSCILFRKVIHKTFIYANFFTNIFQQHRRLVR